MTTGTLAIALFVAWLACEVAILRPARDRSGANVDSGSLQLLASSNLLMPLVSIALYLLDIGNAAFPPALRWTGLGLMIAGFALRWSGMWTLRRYFSANVAVQSDHRLIIHGPYRWVRHPGYCGGWLAFCGLALALANWIAVVLLVAGTLPAFFYRMAVEERALRAAFPDYADYARRVRRFGIF